MIARAQVLVPHRKPDSFFDGIKKLNELRNSLAHNLESPKLKNKTNYFLNAVESEYSEELIEHRSRENKAIEARIRSAISFILGQLDIMDNVVEFMEKFRHYGDTSGEPVGPPIGEPLR